MSIQDDILQAIQDEIINDPNNVGYAGKTDAEIQKLLNSPVVVERIVYDNFPSPINRILSGLSGAPNIVEVSDVASAKIIVKLDPAPVKPVGG